jgi:hypothetical protein
VEEEDAELAEFQARTLAAAAAGRGGGAAAAAGREAAGNGTRAAGVHRLATQKWTSQRGANVVKRIQKELIQVLAKFSPSSSVASIAFLRCVENRIREELLRVPTSPPRKPLLPAP